MLTVKVQPSLIFLDEPTSGLDSQSAWAIVCFLRDLADSGQSIVCTCVPFILPSYAVLISIQNSSTFRRTVRGETLKCYDVDR